MAKSPKKDKNQNGNGVCEEKNAKGDEEGGDKPVSEQPVASPEMTTPVATDIATGT